MHAVVIVSRVLTVVLFGVAIALPAIDSVWQIDSTPRPIDTRTRIAKPSLDWAYSTIAEFPARYTQYYEDEFGFRSGLYRMNQWFNLNAFRVTGTDDAVYGSDGWLFYRPEIETDFQPLDERTLDQIVAKLGSYDSWLKSRGVQFVFMVVPNKSTIYPEYLPRGARSGEFPTRLDQLAERLEAMEDGVRFVDLRDVLIRAKSEERLYYKTDTHWSGGGQRISYEVQLEVLADLFKPFSEFDPPALRASSISTQQHFSQLHTYRGFERERITEYEIVDPRAEITNIWKPESTDGRTVWSVRDDLATPAAVILHDSFFQYERLIGELQRETFSDLVSIQYVQGTSMAPRIRQTATVVERRQPDLVILEIVERNLHMIAYWPAFEEGSPERVSERVARL